MRQVFLAVALIATAIGMFALGRAFLPGQSPAALLGDLAPLQAIVTDVHQIAQTGDLPAAAARINDLETGWDDAEPTMRPLNLDAWGRVDGAIDTALRALRSNTPDPAAVDSALVAVTTAMADPGAAGTSEGGIVMIGEVAVTDATGHPLPCEAMLTTLRDGLAAKPPAAETAATITDLLAKATERCNADDDQHADAFSAAALQELSKI